MLQVEIDAALLENDRCCRIDLVGLCPDSMAALGYGWLRPGQAGDGVRGQKSGLKTLLPVNAAFKLIFGRIN